MNDLDAFDVVDGEVLDARVIDADVVVGARGPGAGSGHGTAAADRLLAQVALLVRLRKEPHGAGALDRAGELALLAA